jgi:hypothetical protein
MRMGRRRNETPDGDKQPFIEELSPAEGMLVLKVVCVCRCLVYGVFQFHIFNSYRTKIETVYT